MLADFYLKIKSLIFYRLTDNYILSFPKSGRTWVRFFLGKYIEKEYEIPFYTNFFTLIKRDQKVERFHFTHGNFFDENIHDLSETLKLLRGKKSYFFG